MKVRELIEQLQQVDPDIEVVFDDGFGNAVTPHKVDPDEIDRDGSAGTIKVATLMNGTTVGVFD